MFTKRINTVNTVLLMLISIGTFAQSSGQIGYAGDINSNDAQMNFSGGITGRSIVVRPSRNG